MRIVILGAGNVATHLAKAMDENCGNVVQVYSHTLKNAVSLAQTLRNAKPIDDFSNVTRDADLYVISVKDDAISTVVDAIDVDAGIVVHTSGSVSVDVLNRKFEKSGVLYPLQTFSCDVAVDISAIPFFVEGCNEITSSLITDVAKRLSHRIYYADSAQRKQLHVAAVFGCNFVNYLWLQADEILKGAGYDFKILEPLILATLDKAVRVSPLKGQTGPARRGDIDIINAHKRLLTLDKATLYQMLSQCIMKKYDIDYE